MARWLFAQRQVTGSTPAVEKRLIEDLRPLLQAATGVPVREPAGDGSFLIDLPGRFLAVDLHKQVRVHIGAHSRTLTGLSIPLRWRAEPAGAAFPQFDGALEYEEWSADVGQLMLVGRYRGPLGLVGGLGDALATHDVADRTAAALLHRLVDEVHAAERTPGLEGTVVGPGVHVRDVMTVDPVVLDEESPLRTAALVLLRARIRGAPVVDDTGALVGMLSERDLLDKETGPSGGWGRQATDQRRRQRARTVGDACTRPALVTAPDSSLHDAADEMARHRISRLVVLDGARIVGIVSRHDVLRVLLRTDAELAEAVMEAMGPLETEGLELSVTDGVVEVSGHATLRSLAVAWIEAAQSVDGVIDVDSRLTWEVDDLTPPVAF